jgi:hypothetical protein
VTVAGYTSLDVTEVNDEQRAQRALKRQRARALAAEAEHERTEARLRDWVVNGTRLTRKELEAGEPCRGCGLPMIDGRGSWPALLKLSSRERAEYDAAEANYKARHGDCRASRWSISGSRSTHCSYCCPPPPLSKRQVEQLASLLSQPVDPRELATWWLVLTCDHIVERWQHRTHDRWSSLPVVECPTCGRHRGIVTADRRPAEHTGASAER